MGTSLSEEGEKFFENYTEKLIKRSDQETVESLRLKKEHSLRVASLSETIATKIDLDQRECELAYLIGLLHDIGRFSQFEKYKSFNDEKTENHAIVGVDIIKQEEFFLALPEADQEVILAAIGDHNKIEVSHKDEQLLTFSKILRDADKLDIWDIAVSFLKRDGSFSVPYICYDLPFVPNVSDVVVKSVLAGKTVRKKDLKSANDFKMMLMSMVYDLNFKASFHILSEKQLIKKIYETMPKRDNVIDAYRKIRLFIENKFVD